MHKYVVISRGRIIGSYDSFIDALKTLVEIGGGEIYRGELIVKLDPGEAHLLKDYLRIEPIEPPEAPTSKRRKTIVVLDQMFKGFFVEVLSKEFPHLEIHIITGKGVEKPYSVGNIVYEPASTDYDVYKLVDKLVSEKHNVLFFTGDKKLYNHMVSRNIKAYYMPPSEYPSKEALVEKMIEIIKSNMK